jgi:hypothetical protein
VALGVSLTATAVAGAQPPDTSSSPYYQQPMSPMPTASPEQRTWEEGRLSAPTNALELSVGTGYTQGFGSLQSGVGMPSVASPGIGVDVGVGYRINPKFAVLVAGQYQELTAERATGARGLTGSLAAQYHFAPLQRLDPWVEVGTGYRMLWETQNIGPTLLTHGFQLARVRVGVDFRAGEQVAIGPMIGADANLFLFQDIPGAQTNISDPTVNTFVFAGLQGRFDVGGGKTSGPPPTIAKR